MESFSIDAIKVRNFKVFNDYSVDFSGNDMVVFSGPNGFGKTTIFDALELAFTGNIDRFKDIESSTGCDDILVSREQGKPVTIEVTLSSQKKQIKIFRSLKNQYIGTSGNKNDKKAGNFQTLWQLQVGDGGSTKPKDMSQVELEKLIGQNELSRYYNLFYYVRQEDTAHFLKRSEKERLVEISRLFDTVDEEKVLKSVESAKKKVNSIKKNVEKNRDDLKKELSSSNDSIKEVPFIKLLPMIDTPWDSEEIHIEDFKAKDNIIIELQRINAIIKHRNAFIGNRKFLHVLSQNDTLVSTIYVGKFVHKIDEVIQRYEFKLRVEGLLSWLDAEKLTEAENINIETISEVIPDFNTADFLSRITDLKEIKKQAASTASICQQLLDIRGKLVNVFEIGANLAGHECPLCGYDWGEHSKVLEEIIKKKSALTEFLSKEQALFQKNKDDLETLVLFKLRNRLDLIIGGDEYKITKSVYDAFKTHRPNVDMVSRFIRWSSENDIVIDELMCDSLVQDIDHDKILLDIEALKNKIKGKIVPLSEEYQADNQGFGFENVYRTYFNSYDKLLEISPTDVDLKIQYINFRYARGLENKIQLLAECVKRISILDNLDKELKKIADVYKSEVGKHRRAIIKDIEIPFYVYSGKILQSIREGSTGGVFVKDPSPGEELKNIRFVSDWKSDHDVINTTSSGQLSGIIIALTLAMNKVYSRGLSSIFIDDPVQTMDDINIISLVDLLRHEFKDKQVFLSTHEDDFERYVLYKYLMQNRNVKKINVMTRKEYSQSSTQ